jgi:hypothetical protein
MFFYCHFKYKIRDLQYIKTIGKKSGSAEETLIPRKWLLTNNAFSKLNKKL